MGKYIYWDVNNLLWGGLNRTTVCRSPPESNWITWERDKDSTNGAFFMSSSWVWRSWGVGGWGKGQDTHQRIATENEKHAANGAFFRSGGWAWRIWVDGAFPRREGVVLVEESIRNRNNNKNIAGIPGTPALFPSLCPSVLPPLFCQRQRV